MRWSWPLLMSLVACNGAWSPLAERQVIDPPMHNRPHPPKPERKNPLDASTGGPLKRIDLAAVRVTEDVLTEGSDEVASNVAACDSAFGSVLGEYWYTFTDAECYAGTSVSLVQLLHNGNDGLGCTIRWIGSLRASVADPFTGVGQDLKRVDLTKFKTVHLQIRGDGRRYRAQFPMTQQIEHGNAARAEAPNDENGLRDCHEEHYDFYGQEFVCGDGTDVWVPLDIDLRSLKQYGFGQHYTFDLADVESFQVVTLRRLGVSDPVGQPAQPGDFQCELRVVGVE
ncbi:MAG TPA: CIA30 family protein [Myxococcota bacterium]|nr:CIA30 family protein [Myxococcota bacterium]